MKKIITTITLGTCFLVFSQVGINTINPQGVFHMDGAKDNSLTDAPDAIQQSNDVIITNTGSMGIGTTVPTTKLELNSGVSNSSGLKFTNLTSATPISSGATLGVDALGNVITMQGSSFSPSFGQVILNNTVTIPANGINYNLLNFTLPVAGTYLINYSIRGDISATGGYGFLASFLSTTPSAGNTIANTEILLFSSYDPNRTLVGRTGTGTLIVTVTAPTTYYVGIRSYGLAGIVSNNTDGRTSVSYMKVTP